MVWLQSKDRFSRVAKLDPPTGGLAIFERRDVKDLPKRLAGSFSQIDGHLLALYSLRGELRFLADGVDFPLGSGTSVEWTARGSHRTLRVRREGHLAKEVLYSVTTDEQFENDPTPFVEDEDFDFGLFVSRVSKCKKRQRVLLGR